MPILRIKLPDRPVEVTHVLEGERITIGRGADNTIQINDRTVSKHHAELVTVNGHYRLHDLASTNRTCVEGQPVTYFHLQEKCQLLFGTIEAEFSPEMPTAQDKRNTEWVPTLAEFEFMRRENRELQLQVETLEKRVEILNSAPLLTRATTVLAISPDIHARVIAARDSLRREKTTLQFDVENLHCDLVTIMRERDALRQAWTTVKSELAEAKEELSRLRQGVKPVPSEYADDILESVPVPPAPAVEPAPIETSDAHRHLAALLTRGPEVIDNLRSILKMLSASPLDEISRRESSVHARTLVDCTRAIQGHPIQRLAVGINALLGDITARPGTFAWTALATLKEALNTISALLNPEVFRRAGNTPHPQVLAIECDEDVVAALVAALEIADIRVVAQGEPAAAISQLLVSEFDLVFIANALPGVDELDLCSEIRALPGYSRTPILFLTTANKVDGRAQALVAGGSDFLCKPFNVLELALKTETWIYRKEFGLLPRAVEAGDAEIASVENGLEALRQLP